MSRPRICKILGLIFSRVTSLSDSLGIWQKAFFSLVTYRKGKGKRRKGSENGNRWRDGGEDLCEVHMPLGNNGTSIDRGTLSHILFLKSFRRIATGPGNHLSQTQLILKLVFYGRRRSSSRVVTRERERYVSGAPNPFEPWFVEGGFGLRNVTFPS